MPFVGAFRGKVQDVVRICHFATNPVGDIFPEAGPHTGVETHDIVLTEVFQARIFPVAHRHFDFILIHGKMPGFIELKASLPRIAKPVRPFAGMAIFLVPDVFLSPKPALFSEREDQLKHIRVPFAFVDAFFDVQNETAGRF